MPGICTSPFVIIHWVPKVAAPAPILRPLGQWDCGVESHLYDSIYNILGVSQRISCLRLPIRPSVPETQCMDIHKIWFKLVECNRHFTRRAVCISESIWSVHSPTHNSHAKNKVYSHIGLPVIRREKQKKAIVTFR